MQIKLTSVLVDDQDKALKFYTEVLGFNKMTDIPMGEFKWLTVVSPGTDTPELLLEPNAFLPAQTFQKALFEAGIAATAFQVGNIQEDFDRLTSLGVHFKTPPTNAGPVTIVVLDDTCGNWIQLYEVN